MSSPKSPTERWVYLSNGTFVRFDRILAVSVPPAGDGATEFRVQVYTAEFGWSTHSTEPSRQDALAVAEIIMEGRV